MSAVLLALLTWANVAGSAADWSCLLQRDTAFHVTDAHFGNAPAAHGGQSPAAPAPAAPAAQDAAAPTPKEKAKADIATALRTELRIPITIRQIHNSPQGPLSHFLQTVQTEFCKALNIPPRRLSILGIRGEYTKLESMLLDEQVEQHFERFNLSLSLVNAAVSNPHEDAHASSDSHGDAHGATAASNPSEASESAHATPDAHGSAHGTAASPAAEKEEAQDNEVIVDLEMLPGSKASDPTPMSLFETLKGLLTTSNSALASGPLAEQLKGSALSLGAKPTGKDAHDQMADGKGGATRSVGAPGSLALALVLWGSVFLLGAKIDLFLL